MPELTLAQLQYLHNNLIDHLKRERNPESRNAIGVRLTHVRKRIGEVRKAESKRGG